MTRPALRLDPVRVRRLVRAQFWRLRRDGIGYVYTSVLPFVSVIGSMIALSEFKGGSLINGRQDAVDIGRQYGAAGDSLEVGLLLLLLPSIAALVTAIGAAAVTRNLVGAETARGGLEELLGAAYTPADIAAASLVFVFALVTGLWAAISALGSIALTTVCLVHHVPVHLGAGYVTMALFLPLLASWSGAGVCLLVNMLFPKLAVPGRLGLGRSGSSVGDLLASLPALGSFAMIGFGLKALGPVEVLLIEGGSTAVITAVSVWSVARWFRPDAVLES